MGSLNRTNFPYPFGLGNVSCRYQKAGALPPSPETEMVSEHFILCNQATPPLAQRQYVIPLVFPSQSSIKF